MHWHVYELVEWLSRLGLALLAFAMFGYIIATRITSERLWRDVGMVIVVLLWAANMLLGVILIDAPVVAGAHLSPSQTAMLIATVLLVPAIGVGYWPARQKLAD